MFPFNENVPATGHDPSNDYQTMQQNNVSSFGIMGVDHLTYGTNGAGTHVQTTFKQYASPANPATNASVAYPAAGVASNSTAEYFFKNSQATFLLSALKAFGQISISAVTSTPITTITNSYNVNVGTSSQAFNGAPNRGVVYTINLNNNIINTNNAAVFLTTNSTFFDSLGYSLTPTTLTITLRYSGSTPSLLNFAILQA